MIIEDNLKAFFRLNKLLYGAHVSYEVYEKWGIIVNNGRPSILK